MGTAGCCGAPAAAIWPEWRCSAIASARLGAPGLEPVSGMEASGPSAWAGWAANPPLCEAWPEVRLPLSAAARVKVSRSSSALA